MNDKQYTILLVDDHLVVRTGIASIISFDPTLKVIAQADDGYEAIKCATDLHPDIILMDLMMPGISGAVATEKILCIHPDTRILILTTFTESPELRQALQAGAIGAINKDASREQLINAIHEVAVGHRHISTDIAHCLNSTSVQLSKRQTEALKLVAKGLTNDEIAGILRISVASVKDRLAGIFNRLNASSRTEAVAIATNEHLI